MAQGNKWLRIKMGNSWILSCWKYIRKSLQTAKQKKKDLKDIRILLPKAEYAAKDHKRLENC